MADTAASESNRSGHPIAAAKILDALACPPWLSRGDYLLASRHAHAGAQSPTDTLVAALGLIVRAAAAGYLRKDRELAVTGPYALTRNPLYLGSAILAAGFVVACHSWIAGLLVSLYFGIFYYAVMRNEEEDLRMRFGARLQRLRCARAAFFPDPSRAENPSLRRGRQRTSKLTVIFLGTIPPQSRISSPVRGHRSHGDGLPANVHSRALWILSDPRWVLGVTGQLSQPERSFVHSGGHQSLRNLWLEFRLAETTNTPKEQNRMRL